MEANIVMEWCCVMYYCCNISGVGSDNKVKVLYTKYIKLLCSHSTDNMFNKFIGYVVILIFGRFPNIVFGFEHNCK